MQQKAFTLIELLVVVLIIGILAAVALPQYQVAVAKSRLAAAFPTIQGIKTGLESYYLANGEYPPTNTPSLDALDVTVNCKTVLDSSVLNCDSSFVIDIFWDTTYGIRAYYCPGYQDAYVTCNSHKDFTYDIFLDHDPQAGEKTCTGYTDFGQRVCKALTNY